MATPASPHLGRIAAPCACCACAVHKVCTYPGTYPTPLYVARATRKFEHFTFSVALTRALFVRTARRHKQ